MRKMLCRYRGSVDGVRAEVEKVLRNQYKTGGAGGKPWKVVGSTEEPCIVPVIPKSNFFCDPHHINEPAVTGAYRIQATVACDPVPFLRPLAYTLPPHSAKF